MAPSQKKTRLRDPAPTMAVREMEMTGLSNLGVLETVMRDERVLPTRSCRSNMPRDSAGLQRDLLDTPRATLATIVSLDPSPLSTHFLDPKRPAGPC